jgi:hypothetical protein
MKKDKDSMPVSSTGATIDLVSSLSNSRAQCGPSEECRPLCEPCTDCGPECAPDCICSPCEEQVKEPAPDQGHYPAEEDQGCEPNS